MGNKEDIKRWAKSFLITLGIFLLVSLYLYIRRGYYDVYIVNKVLGSTAVILGGITLLVGPLSKKYFSLAGYMTIRRHLGLIAMGVAVLHVAFSLLQQKRFPFPQWYIEEWMPVGAGIIALGLWAYLVSLSRNAKIREMGSDLWKRNLSWFSRIAFVAIFLHLVIMKYPGWIRWLQGQVRQTPELANPGYPPASLFIFLFMCVVIIYRIYTFFVYERKKQ